MQLPWASMTVLIPLVTALACGVVSSWRSMLVGVVGSVATAGASVGLIGHVAVSGAFAEPLGGWSAPLGIELYVDGFGASMIALVAVVGLAVSFFSISYFRGPASHSQGRYFWSLWLVLWSSLNGIFVSADLFNLYVCLEVMGLSSVALVALAGPASLRAALRYLFVTLVGSLLYLLGVALIYGGWGTVAIAEVAVSVEATMASAVAFGAMTIGLVLKTALVPLHFWLPTAHANAPTPVSAVLSGLVVKASFYILVRLWVDVFEVLDTTVAAWILATAGVVAIGWGSIQALRQQRLKMLVAYSTVAQLGYLFVAFAPSTVDAATPAGWQGMALFVVAHGCAKGAMFLAAGTAAAAVGSGRLKALSGHRLRLFVPMAAFGLAGLSIVGVSPTGGYAAKSLLAAAAAEAEMTLVEIVFDAGAILAALYVLKVFYFAFLRSGRDEGRAGGELSWSMALVSVLLGAVAVGIGMVSEVIVTVLEVGAPFGEG